MQLKLEYLPGNSYLAGTIPPSVSARWVGVSKGASRYVGAES